MTSAWCASRASAREPFVEHPHELRQRPRRPDRGAEGVRDPCRLRRRPPVVVHDAGRQRRAVAIDEQDGPRRRARRDPAHPLGRHPAKRLAGSPPRPRPTTRVDPARDARPRERCAARPRPARRPRHPPRRRSPGRSASRRRCRPSRGVCRIRRSRRATLQRKIRLQVQAFVGHIRRPLVASPARRRGGGDSMLPWIADRDRR